MEEKKMLKKNIALIFAVLQIVTLAVWIGLVYYSRNGTRLWIEGSIGLPVAPLFLVLLLLITFVELIIINRFTKDINYLLASFFVLNVIVLAIVFISNESKERFIHQNGEYEVMVIEDEDVLSGSIVFFYFDGVFGHEFARCETLKDESCTYTIDGLELVVTTTSGDSVTTTRYLIP